MEVVVTPTVISSTTMAKTGNPAQPPLCVSTTEIYQPTQPKRPCRARWICPSRRRCYISFERYITFKHSLPLTLYTPASLPYPRRCPSCTPFIRAMGLLMLLLLHLHSFKQLECYVGTVYGKHLTSAPPSPRLLLTMHDFFCFCFCFQTLSRVCVNSERDGSFAAALVRARPGAIEQHRRSRQGRTLVHPLMRSGEHHGANGHAVRRRSGFAQGRAGADPGHRLRLREPETAHVRDGEPLVPHPGRGRGGTVLALISFFVFRLHS